MMDAAPGLLLVPFDLTPRLFRRWVQEKEAHVAGGGAVPAKPLAR